MNGFRLALASTVRFLHLQDRRRLVSRIRRPIRCRLFERTGLSANWNRERSVDSPTPPQEGDRVKPEEDQTCLMNAPKNKQTPGNQLNQRVYRDSHHTRPHHCWQKSIRYNEERPTGIDTGLLERHLFSFPLRKDYGFIDKTHS